MVHKSEANTKEAEKPLEQANYHLIFPSVGSKLVPSQLWRTPFDHVTLVDRQTSQVPT